MIKNLGETYFGCINFFIECFTETIKAIIILILFTLILPFLLIMGLLHFMIEGKDEI